MTPQKWTLMFIIKYGTRKIKKFQKWSHNMEKITILGGSGFLGSALSDYLSETNKFKIKIFDIKKKKKN